MAYVILIIVIAVLGLAAAGWLLLVRPRRQVGRSARPAVPPSRPGAPPAGSGQAGTAVADRAEAPEAPAAGAPQAPQAELERPPPSAGRLAALRGRLARSQSGLGSVLAGSAANSSDCSREPRRQRSAMALEAMRMSHAPKGTPRHSKRARFAKA